MPSEHLLLTFPVPDSLLAHIKEKLDFESVEYYPSTYVEGSEYRWHHKPPVIPESVWDKITVQMTMFYLPEQSQCKNLKLIQGMSAGIEHFISSIQALKQVNSSLKVATASGVHATSIAEYVIMYSLNHFHRLPVLQSIQADKAWNRSTYVESGQLGGFQELRTQVIGIIGYGAIGREVARLASSFGMTIIVATSTGTKKPSDGFTLANTGDPEGSIPETWYNSTNPDSFKQFMTRCSILVISAPSTESTRSLINANTLSFLSPSSIIVNVGRGPIIDHDALIEALENDKLAAAILDVTDPEPLPANHKIWSTKNLTVTPHIAGAGDLYAARCVDLLAVNVDRIRSGKKVVNEVNSERGY